MCTLQIAATVDLFPTISKLADVAIPTDRIIDGVDMSPILFEDKIVCNLYVHNHLLQYSTCECCSIYVCVCVRCAYAACLHA